MENICLAQFAKMYESGWTEPTRRKNPVASLITCNDEEMDICLHSNGRCSIVCEENKFDFLMTKDGVNFDVPLSQRFKLTDPFPDEPPFIKKRKKPANLRFHKVNPDKEVERYWFSECLLYNPFRNENDIVKKLEGFSSGYFLTMQKEIQVVKSHVTEYLDSTAKASIMVQEASRNQKTGEQMDTEGEQELGKYQEEDAILHPDFAHLNPDDQHIPENQNKVEKQFRQIKLMNVLIQKRRNLDVYQKMVMERRIRYARNLVKPRNCKASLPKPCNTIVCGRAECGKSHVINILKQWFHLILQQNGDNPGCPYLVVTAPTDTAACNVQG